VFILCVTALNGGVIVCMSPVVCTRVDIWTRHDDTAHLLSLLTVGVDQMEPEPDGPEYEESSGSEEVNHDDDGDDDQCIDDDGERNDFTSSNPFMLLADDG